MAIAFIVYAKSDAAFVEGDLTGALPSLGFTGWTSNTHGMTPQVVFVVVSAAAAESKVVRHEASRALESKIPTIPVLTDETSPAEITPALALRACADFRNVEESFQDAYRTLARVLPVLEPMEGERHSPASSDPLPLNWNETVFSDALADALARQDHAATESLVAGFERYAASRPPPYNVEHATRDLKALKRYRKFGLMARLGVSVRHTGTTDRGSLRKLHAQALIEQGSYAEAREALEDILRDPDSEPFEINEAKGLTGRVVRQDKPA